MPDSVNVRAFARVKDGRIELLVRVPLAALNDIQFPTTGAAEYLDLGAVESMLHGVARYWIAPCFEVYEDGLRAPKSEVAQARISVQSDQSFGSFQEASAHLDAPRLPPDAQVFLDQVWLDIRLEYPLHSRHPAIAIAPKVATLGVRVTTDLKVVGRDGAIRELSFASDPGMIFLAPRRQDTFNQYLKWGIHWVSKSADILLFLFCLTLPLRRWRDALAPAVAFAGALSLALLVSAFGPAPDLIWLRPLIETLSAVAILLSAFANIAGRITRRGRSLLALGSGCVFGFSCSFDLGEKIQFAGAHTAIAPVAFDVGVAIAAVAALGLLFAVLSLLFRFARSERVELIVISAIAADTAWGWLTERWARLNKVPIHVPAFDADLLAMALRWLMVLTLAGGAWWFLNGWLKSRRSRPLNRNEAAPRDRRPVV